MLAVLTDDHFSDENWLYERKLDGVRAICSRDGDTPVLWSRNRKRMNDSYPELVSALAELGGQRFVADGEIVAFDGSRTSFAALQPRIHLVDAARVRSSRVKVFYYPFDLLHLDDQDTTRLPLRERKRLLRGSFEFTAPLRLSQHRNADGEAYFRLACERGWEGLIAKRANATYRHGRSPDWLKFTCHREQEFVIGGFTDPQGGRTGFGALLLGYYDAGELRYAGKVGTGFGATVLRELHSALRVRQRDTSPFTGRVRERGSHWVRPDLVAQIVFTEWTSDGKLRHPRFTGIRTDKSATDVAREST